ncbi:XRE family transcriptional regulator [Streptomyces sp. MK5]|uniref:helix-turn-helix domain-containing protein n=1 Tax=Streptomyces sp. MK5 TaxID=3064253 RepID=UPI0027425C8B|nr:XRE family transcriptional regulator [Streptomyces sp. MK5]
MARWKALPDELDPQVKEFAGQLRRLVDRSGLSVAALADRTGYSRTSWERYLGGRLLAPKGAVVALAEVTGSNPVHLTTMWELAERAWSRAESRHDRTMEAIRIAQARAALDAPGARTVGSAAAAPRLPAPGVADPAGVSPTAVPPQPTVSDADARDAREAAPVSAAASGSAPAPGSGPRPPRTGTPSRFGTRGRQLTMFLAGMVAVLVVVGAVFHFTGGDDGRKAPVVRTSPSPSVSTGAGLPPGVKCDGSGCTGKDAEAMGCSGELVTTARSVTVGTTVVEVRYSKTCGTAWGRITQAAQGDQVQVTVGTRTETDKVTEPGDTIAYTPMVAVKDAAQARACVTLASGRTGCTT